MYINGICMANHTDKRGGGMHVLEKNSLLNRVDEDDFSYIIGGNDVETHSGPDRSRIHLDTGDPLSIDNRSTPARLTTPLAIFSEVLALLWLACACLTAYPQTRENIRQGITNNEELNYALPWAVSVVIAFAAAGVRAVFMRDPLTGSSMTNTLSNRRLLVGDRGPKAALMSDLRRHSNDDYHLLFTGKSAETQANINAIKQKLTGVTVKDKMAYGLLARRGMALLQQAHCVGMSTYEYQVIPPPEQNTSQIRDECIEAIRIFVEQCGGEDFTGPDARPDKDFFRLYCEVVSFWRLYGDDLQAEYNDRNDEYVDRYAAPSGSP